MCNERGGYDVREPTVASCLSSFTNMIAAAVVFAFLWVLVLSESSAESETFLEKKKRFTPRGYYGYPYLPFTEPLTILAGLAFIAYIIQTFNAVYHNHHGLGNGGLLNNVLPGKGRESFPRASRSATTNLAD